MGVPRAGLERPAIASCLVVVLAGAIAVSAEARSLRDVVGEIATFIPEAQTPKVTRTAVQIQRNAVRSSDFITTATAPAFVYEFDPGMDAPERIAFGGAPVFIEPGYTLGGRLWDVALSYQYYDFAELDGEPLVDVLDDIRPARVTGFNVDNQAFSLRSHVTSLSVTRGLTDRWDVNLLMPLVFTELRLARIATQRVNVRPVEVARQDTDTDRVGAGDFLLRTKYQLNARSRTNVAALLSVRMPTGNENDFQGLGDVIVTPFLAATYASGRLDLHASGGVDLNADDLERCRLRYGVGVTARLIQTLASFGGVTGNSGLADDRFSERGVSGTVARSDLVDATAGLKLSPFRYLTVHVEAIVPLTADGLRPDVVPSGGVEMTW